MPDKTQPAIDKLTLEADKRTVFGKKLKALRREKKIPGNIFGPEFKSQALTIEYSKFAPVYRVAKETGIVYLRADKNEWPVLIKNVQRHPIDDTILHVDFRKIDLKKKIETQVPIKITGESEAVKQKGGVLLHLIESVLVEALPQDIPHEIVIDIAKIKDIGQEIKVSDLPQSKVYLIKDEPKRVVVSVVEHKEESVAPETAAPATEVITAKPEEGAVAPKEGEEPVSKASEGKPAEAKGATPASPVKAAKPEPTKKPSEGKK